MRTHTHTHTCGITATFSLSWVSPTSAMRQPSISMLPPANSTMRVSATNSDDLPAPVRPTTPIFSPGRTPKDRPRRTRGSDGR